MADDPGLEVEAILHTQTEGTQDEDWKGILLRMNADSEPQDGTASQRAPSQAPRPSQPIADFDALDGEDDDEIVGLLARMQADTEQQEGSALHTRSAGPAASSGQAGSLRAEGLLNLMIADSPSRTAGDRASAAAAAQRAASGSRAAPPVALASVPEAGELDDGFEDVDMLMEDVREYETELQAYVAQHDAPDDLFPDDVPLQPQHAPPAAGPAQPQAQRRPAAAAPGAARPPTAAAAPAQQGITEAQIDELFDDALLDEPEPVEPEPVPEAPSRLPRLLLCDVEGDYVSVTCAAGLRVYCGLEAPVGGEQIQGVQEGRRVQLLTKPIDQMLADANESRTRRAMEESARLAADVAALQQEEMAAEQGLFSPQRGGPAATPARTPRPAAAGAADRTPAPAARPDPSKDSEALWVAKYAPKRFMNLLSDEQTNRQVCQWVKSWDACVFGRAIGPATAHAQQQQAAGKRGFGANTAGGARGAGGRRGAGSGGSDAKGRLGDPRPEKKVILFCGPPGLGKTTLAHVVAKHCGYHPYEINASDDRTAAKLTDRVQDAVQMQPVLGVRKPNLVIIDEIDGATGGAEGHGAINALMSIINAGNNTGGGDDDGGGEEGAGGKGGAKKGGRRGRGSKHTPLMRPIICIANDLYAPALRPLRDVALIFHFRAPDVDKLVSRLELICEQEGVNIDRAALFTLAERSDCDIRTCLNTLQFLARQAGHRPRGSPTPARPSPPGQAGTTPGHARHAAHTRSQRGHAHGTHGPRITANQIEKLGIGTKDAHKSLFALWDAMLQLPRHMAGAGSAGAARRAWMRELYGMLQDHGEYDIIMAGLQENLLSVRYLDVHLKHTSKMMDALGHADILIQAARRRGDYYLESYVPTHLLLLHLYAAQPEKPHIAWPKAQMDSNRRAQSHREVLHSWVGAKVQGRVLQAHPAHTLLKEVIPSLVRLLSPSLRPLAPNLLSPVERQSLISTAATMCDWGVRYDMDEEANKPAWAAKAALAQGAPHGPKPRPVPLDPPLDTLQSYDISTHTAKLTDVTPVRPVAPVLRQLLNQQATLETIRRNELIKHQGQGPLDQGDPLSSPSVLADITAHTGPSKPQPHTTAAVVAKKPAAPGKAPQAPGPVKGIVKTQPRNWLDAIKHNQTSKRRAKTVSWQGKDQTDEEAQDNGAHTSSSAPKHQFPVLYRFKEGYTNAVKRPMLTKEFL